MIIRKCDRCGYVGDDVKYTVDGNELCRNCTIGYDKVWQSLQDELRSKLDAWVKE